MGNFRPYTEKDSSAFHLCAVQYMGGGPIYTIVGWTGKEVLLSDGGWYSYSELLNDYMFVDGSPCGIEEGGEE